MMTREAVTTKQWAFSLVGVVIAVGLGSRDAQASFLQAPQIGGRDGGLAGSVVAAPTDGTGILLFNPAGVVGRPDTEVTASLITSTIGRRYTNPYPGYDQESSETPFGPLLEQKFIAHARRTFCYGVGLSTPGPIGCGCVPALPRRTG